MCRSGLFDWSNRDQSLVSNVGGYDGAFQYMYPRQKRWCLSGSR